MVGRLFIHQKYKSLIIISLIFSSILFLYTSTSPNSSNNKIRNLTFKDDLENIYKLTSKTFRSFYEDISLDYTYQIHSKGKPQSLIQYLESKDIKYLKEYIFRILPYLIISIIFILFLICFIVYCFICCCCPNCCCRSKATPIKINNCCNCTFISSIIFYLLVIIFSGLDAFLIKYIKEIMNETVYSLFIIPYSLENGLKSNSFSNWKGFSSSLTVLNSTLTFVNETTRNKSDNSTYEYLNEQFSLFEKQLNYIEYTYLNKTMKNPEPDNNDLVNPIYLGNKLSLILKETRTIFNKNIINFSSSYHKILNVTNDLNHYKNDVVHNLNVSQIQLKEVSNVIFNFTVTKANKFIKFQKNLNDYGYLSFFLILCFLCITALFGMIFTIFYSLVLSCQQMRYLINLMWILMMTVTIFNFIYGIGFGLIGILSIDYALVFNNASSSENLDAEYPVVIHNKTLSYLMDNCINKDGNLSYQLGLHNFSMHPECPNEKYSKYNYLQTLYDYYPIINNSVKTMNKSNDYKQYIQSYLTELELYKDNASLVYNDLIKLKNELNMLTNIEGFNDIWIINENDCPNNINISNIYELGEKPKCINLNVTNDIFDCEERYNSLIDNSKICNLIYSISSFINNNNELILQLLQDINNISQIYSTLYIEIGVKLNNSNHLLSQLNEIYNPLLTVENVTEIYSIFDCKYIKPYLNKIYETFDYELSKDCLNFSSFILINCFLCWASATISLFVIGKYKIETPVSCNTELDDKSMFAKPENLKIMEGGGMEDIIKNGEKIQIQKNIKVEDSVQINNN